MLYFEIFRYMEIYTPLWKSNRNLFSTQIVYDLFFCNFFSSSYTICTHKKVEQHFSLLNNEEHALIGIVQHRKYCMYTLHIWQMNNQYMPNSKPIKIGKIKNSNLLYNPLCNVDILVINRFWSSYYTPKSINNALNDEGLKIVLISSVWHNSQCVTWTPKKHQKWRFKVYFTDM